MLAAWLILSTAPALARCPEPGEIRLSLLYPRDTAAASAVSGASFHNDIVLSAVAGPNQQVLRGQIGLCDWMFSAEVRGDLMDGRTVSPVLGAARSRAVGRVRGTVEGLVGAEGLSPLVSARLRISRPSVRLTPYLLVESAQVFSLTGATLREGWTVSSAAGIGYGLRDRVGVGFAATAEVLPEPVWGGQVGVFLKR